MRVLFLWSSADWSGSARVFAAAAEGLARRGHQAVVACRAESLAERRFSSTHYTLVPIELGDAPMWDAIRLRPVLREHFVEVTFVHTEAEQVLASAASRLAERGAVVRRCPAGSRPDRGRGARLAERLAATGWMVPADGSTAGAGPNLLEPVSSELGIDPEGMDQVRPAQRSTLGVEAGGRLIVCVCDRGARRRTAGLLRAVALLVPRHPELRIAMVGPGSDDEDLRMHAAALGITEVVHHLGERDDHRDVARAADLAWVVADGDDAVFGFLDMMAARVPVVADRTSLAQRYVADGITGLLLPHGDPAMLAARVSSLLANEDRRLAMGNAARARVARDFPEAAMVAAFEEAARTARDRTRWRT